MIEHFLRLLESRNQSKIDTIVAQIVEASFEEVCTKISTRCNAMTLSETRGYVRVRAAQIVRRHTRRQIARSRSASQGIPERWANTITRQATERIVPQALRQLSRSIRGRSTRVATPAQRAA